ncbi:MAG: tetratricopeptide repeat protein [Thermoanaerobaculia bacterium]
MSFRLAAPFFERALELDPNFALAYARLGTIYRNFGELEKAAEYRTKAYELRDWVSERERLYITSHYHASLGDLEAQNETLELTKQAYPRDYVAHHNLALNLMAIGDFDQVLINAQEALRLAPEQAFPYHKVVWAYRSLGRSGEAKSVGELALDRGQDAVYLREELALEQDRPAEAIRLLETARNYEKRLQLTIYLRGLAYLADDSPGLAASEFDRLLGPVMGARSIELERPLDHLGLARAHALSGDVMEARKAYQTFFEVWQQADEDIPILLEARAEYESLQ